jgi:hypothetical protein
MKRSAPVMKRAYKTPDFEAELDHNMFKLIASDIWRY